MSSGAALLLLSTIACAAPVNVRFYFEENRGQTAPEVQFLAPGSPAVFFTLREAVVAFTGAGVVRIRPLGAASRRPEALEVLPGKSNYLNREPSIVNVRHYARVRYKSIYPGIDLSYHGSRNKIEYDFEAEPGARPDRIRLRLEGASGLHLDGEGNLIAHVGNATFIQKKPQAWQSMDGIRAVVDVRYVLRRKQEIAFAIGGYDHSRPLVIDPLIDYITDLGALAASAPYSNDTATGIAADTLGNAYVIGSATSGQFPITIGPASPASGDMGFIAKLSSDGTRLLYSTYLNLPAPQAIAVDQQGSTYVGGLGYVAKLTPDGSAFTYNHAFPTNLGAFVTFLSIDSAGNVYAAGYTFATNLPTTAGAYQSTFPGQVSILGSNTSYGFLMKLNPSGNVVYSTYLRQPLTGAINQFAKQFLAINPVAQNAVMVTSTTPTATGQASASLLKFGPSGGVLSTTNAAATPIIVQGVANDSAGNVYLACNGPGFNGQTSIGPNFLLEFDPNDTVIGTKTIHSMAIYISMPQGTL